MKGDAKLLMGNTLGASGGQVGQHTDLKEHNVRNLGGVHREGRTTVGDAESSVTHGGRVVSNKLGLPYHTDRLWLSRAASSNPLLPPQMSARCQRRGEKRRQVLSFLKK